MKQDKTPPVFNIDPYCYFESLGWEGFIDVRGITCISPVFEEEGKMWITVHYDKSNPVKLYAKSLENANELAKHIFNEMNRLKLENEKRCCYIQSKYMYELIYEQGIYNES